MMAHPESGRAESASHPGPVLTHHDITAAAFDITPALIVVLDRKGRIQRFNAACERLIGHREADVIGEVLWPLVLDAPEAARAQAVYDAMTPGHPIGPYENYWITPQGERRYITWATTHLLGVDGDIELLVATGLDVTEERRSRLEREESEARFRALFEHSGDGVVLLDPHDPVIPWRIVECNEAFARMNGYGVHELIGRSIDVLHEDDLMARQGNSSSGVGPHPGKRSEGRGRPPPPGRQRVSHRDQLQPGDAGRT